MSQVELRTYTYVDVLQPQTASFLATVARGYLPVEQQAALVIEIAPGMDINVVMDVALKRTGVQPGMMIVERVFGMMELHSFDQGEVRAAGEAVLDALELKSEERLAPRIQTTQIITGVDSHHTMLINRTRHGNFLLKNEALYILEVHPAGYAIFAANEAEKAADVFLVNLRPFGAFGRLWMSGPESEIDSARDAAMAALDRLEGRQS